MRKLLSAHILLTLECNFRCKYCFVTHKPRYMTEFTLRNTMEMLINPDVVESKFHIEFFGGEPLLSSDLVLKGADYARELGKKRGINVSVGLVSNMALITKDLLHEFRARDIDILASYDGAYTHNETRHPNSAQVVKDNIKLAVAEGVRCAVATQIVSGHISNLYENVVDVLDSGVTTFALNPVLHGYSPFTEEDFNNLDVQFGLIVDLLFARKIAGSNIVWSQMDNQLSAILRVARHGKQKTNYDWGCGGCKGSLAIDPEGYIMPCQQMPTGGDFDHWCMGHVASGRIDSDVRANFLTAMFPECSECGVLRCAPCRTVNKSTTGSEFQKSPQTCQFQRLLFTHAVKFHNRLADHGYYDTKGSVQSV